MLRAVLTCAVKEGGQDCRGGQQPQSCAEAATARLLAPHSQEKGPLRQMCPCPLTYQTPPWVLCVAQGSVSHLGGWPELGLS